MAPENFYLAPEFMCFILVCFMVFLARIFKKNMLAPEVFLVLSTPARMFKYINDKIHKGGKLYSNLGYTYFP
jgi:hypothetical protein